MLPTGGLQRDPGFIKGVSSHLIFFVVLEFVSEILLHLCSIQKKYLPYVVFYRKMIILINVFSDTVFCMWDLVLQSLMQWIKVTICHEEQKT